MTCFIYNVNSEHKANQENPEYEDSDTEEHNLFSCKTRHYERYKHLATTMMGYGNCKMINYRSKCY